MKTVLSSPGGFEEQNGGWKGPQDRELFFGFRSLHCPPQPAVPNPTSCLDFLHGGSVLEPGHPRTQGPGPWAKLLCDPSDSTNMSVPLHRPQGQGSLCVSWSPSSPIHRALFFSFVFSRAAPASHGSSQARGPIRAVVSGLCHSHSNWRSDPHLQPTPQLMATADP